ncbi:hypothetical protein BCD49_33035 [Pseudofrankia sp. EUN1h]|nr:hypothetical protein BCD49_33035 [Pseudofrankia sp. EUN1h]
MQVPTSTGTVTVPARFEGPPGSANGGWIAGTVAERLPEQDSSAGSGWAAEVVLRARTPLDVTLTVEAAVDGGVRLLHDGTLLVEAHAVPDSIRANPAPFIELAAAEQAAAAFPGFPGGGGHPFPNCFGCGTGRAPGDGLRLLAGPVPGGPPGLTATPWTVHPSLASADGTIGRHLLWSALDCASFWVHQAALPTEALAALLARQTVAVAGSVLPGETYVVVARADSAEGRKLRASSALYARDGMLVAACATLWIRIPPITQP